MFHKFIHYLRLQLRLHNLFHLGPYRWAKGVSYPVALPLPPSGKSRSRVFYRLNLGMHLVYSFGMTLNFLLTMHRLDSAGRMLGAVFLDCFIAVFGMRLVFWMKEGEGLRMAKQFLQFEAAHPNLQARKPDLILEGCMLIGLVTYVSLPCFMLCLLLYSPCLPPHLGYILFHSPSGCGTFPWPLRLPLLLFDAYMWLSVAGTAVFFNTGFFLLGAKCMSHYLAKSREDLSSKFSSSSYSIYRQIHLLNKSFDEVLQALFIPSIIGGSLTAIVISLYACFKLHRLIPMPGLSFFPLLALDGLCGIVSVKMAAGVLDQSQKWLRMANRSSTAGGIRLQKKLVRSLATLKVRFGSTNFIDKLTPIILLEFCLIHTASLMLLT